jgi:diaminobutyrate-2-oxoglutarate transaminase
MARDRLWERSAALGTAVLEHLRATLAATPAAGEIRGLGLFVGVEIVRGSGDAGVAGSAPDPEAATRIRDACRERGVIVGLGGAAESVIKVSPPLTIDEADLWPAVDIVIEEIRNVQEGRA